MTSKFVRKYRSLYGYEANESSELTIREGDVVLVHPKADGQWPNAEKWMKGTNQRTNQSGDFPGNYTEFIGLEEIPPTPPPRPKPRPRSTVDPDQTLEPPVPARRQSGQKGPTRPSPAARLSPAPMTNQPPPTPTRPSPVPQDKKAHSWVEDVFKVPFKCSFCESQRAR